VPSVSPAPPDDPPSVPLQTTELPTSSCCKMLWAMVSGMSQLSVFTSVEQMVELHEIIFYLKF
jgi:hypothetical protein